MSTILIAGANGQLGRDCQRVLNACHTVAAMDLPELDITEADSIARAIARVNPEFVVNAAAFTQVDRAETDGEGAYRVNALGPELLADACRRAGIALIHVSTDYVFDGQRPPPAPYVETDPPAPQSRYGHTKLAGETAVLQGGGEVAVFRTAWLYGQHGNNFLRTLLRLALTYPERTLRVVDDQHGCPTWSGRLALQIAEWIDDFTPGLYHAVALGHCTWYQLAARFLQRANVPHRIEPCSTADYPTPAKRPANSILVNQALHALDRCVMLPWETDLDAFAERVAPMWRNELVVTPTHCLQDPCHAKL